MQTADLPIPGVDAQLQADWLAVRKAKRAGPITQTVLDSLEREAAKAAITVAEALRTCCEAGWQGFRADWFANRNRQAHASPAAAIADTGETPWQRAARLRMEQFAPGIAAKPPGEHLINSDNVIDVETTHAKPVPDPFASPLLAAH